MGHTKQQVFATTPSLVLVQLHERPPELLLQSLKSRNVSTLGLQSHVGDLSRRSAVPCLLHFSSPVSALYVLRRRSPLPSTSNSGRSSSRTDLASNSSASPIECVTSHQSDRRETHLLMHRLKGFVGRLMSCRYLLQLFLQFLDDSFSDSQSLMGLFRGHGCV